MKIQRRILEKSFFFVALIFIFLGLLFDYNILNPLMEMKSKDIESQMNTVLQVQASVATLGIALSSLLSGSYKDAIYGISISRYIMHIKPIIFKHRNVIFSELVLIVAGYITVVFNLINTLIVIFFFSIIMMGLMVYDIFMLFNGNKFMETEIGDYCLNSFNQSNNLQEKKEILLAIRNDVDFAIDTNTIWRLKLNLDMYIAILGCLAQRVDISNEDEIKIWSEFYEGICNTVFQQENIIPIYKVINSLPKVLSYKHGEIFNVWGNVSYSFFLAIDNSCFEYKDFLISDILEIHNNLYKNTKYNSKNDYSILVNYSSNIYNSFFVRKKNINTHLKVLLFEAIKVIDYFEIEEAMKEVAHQEMCEYTKVLINSCDNSTLKSTFLVILERGLSIKYVRYIFTILLYLYYLMVEKDDLIKSELREFVNEFFESNKESISNFILSSKYEKSITIKKSINEIFEQAKKWEMFPGGKAKWVIMDNVKIEFFVFYILSVTYDYDELINNLSTIMTNDEITFHNYFISNRERTKSKFSKFYKLYLKQNLSQEVLSEYINKLENAIVDIYKKAELKNASEKCFDNDEIRKKILSINKQLYNEITKKTEIFKSIKPENIVSLKRVYLIHTYPDFILENEIIQMVNTWFVGLFIGLIREKTIAKKVSYNGQILNEFFSLINDSKITPDTLIGYRKWFYMQEGEERFKDFESKVHKIQAEYFSNLLLAIDSKKIYMNITGVNVKMRKLTNEEIFEDCIPTDDEVYMYNIVNDIKLPFTKKELTDYVANIKRVIDIELDFEYGFNTDSDMGVIVNITDKD